MLAKRLVQHMSASDDAEASMISKLKQVIIKVLIKTFRYCLTLAPGIIKS